MGSGGSKAKDAAAAAAAASSSGGGGGGGASGRKGRPRGTRVFGSACFGFPSSSSSSDGQFRKGDGSARSKGIKCTVEVDGKSSGRNREVSQKHNKHSPSVTPASASLDGERIVEDGDGTLINISGASSSSATTTDIIRSTNPTARPLSCFGFAHHDDVNFRLNRAVSLGSSSARSLFSSGLSINQSDVDGLHLHTNFDTSPGANSMRDSGAAATDLSLDLLRDNVRDELRASQRIHRSRVESENSVTRNSYRRLGQQEPSEGSVRFSRTLSVGRLRDRVLRRTPFSEGLFSPSIPDGRSVWSAGQTNARRVLGVTRRGASSSNRIIERHPDSSGHFSNQINTSTDNNSDRALETLQPREPSNHDILDHRSAFLERRRRIRSQVCTLQRLGSRFENLSGHDRSCILSGQHRTGRCTCRTTNRPGTSDDDTSTRASISRIVMLAEALFEVLDEIHQQSVFLSSRPSFSAIGSVPAPKEVVECIPVKVYRKPAKQQNDEAAQCYICLVEYEEGECMRILPCNHEFHLTCIDKWLKEIHRVCPLCRGDVCRSDASTTGKS